MLYELGWVEEADRAMMRFESLAAGLDDGDVSDLVERYHEAADSGERADVAGKLLDHLGDRVDGVLHDFLARSRHASPAATWAP